MNTTAKLKIALTPLLIQSPKIGRTFWTPCCTSSDCSRVLISMLWIICSRRSLARGDRYSLPSQLLTYSFTLFDREVAWRLMAGTTAATTPVSVPITNRIVTITDNTRFFRRHLCWKKLTIGAKIYATTKLIKNGSNTPLKRRINRYNATNTTIVTTLRIIVARLMLSVLYSVGWVAILLFHL